MTTAPYRNFTFVLLGRLSDYALTLGLLSGLARLAGGEILGIYYFARSVGTFTATISELGLSRLTIKLLAETPKRYSGTFPKLIAIRSIASTLALLLLYILMLSLNLSPEVTHVTVLFALGLAVFQVADLYLDVRRAAEDMLTPVILNVLQRTMYVALALIGLALGYRLAWVLTTFVIVNLLHLGVSALLIHTKYGRPGIGFSSNAVRYRTLVSHAGSFTVVVLLGAISGRLSILFLYYFQDHTSVGLYGAAIHIVEALFYIAYAVTSVAYPNLVRLHSNKEPEFVDGVRAVAKVLLLFIAPIAYLLFLAAEPLILIIYGQEYGSSVLIFRIAIFAAVPGFLNAFLLILLQATGRHRLAAILMLPFILIHGIAGLLLIPEYSGAGAASAFAFAEVCHFLALVVAASRIVTLSDLFGDLWKLLVAVTAMVLMSTMLSPLGIVAQLIAGALTYSILALSLKPFSTGELHWMQASLASPRHHADLGRAR